MDFSSLGAEGMSIEGCHGVGGWVGETGHALPKGKCACKIGGSHSVFTQDTMVSFVFDKTTTGVFPFRTAIFFFLELSSVRVDDTAVTLQTLASDTSSNL